jgi:uncharacterized membrane protein (UPF0182 family)
MELPFWALLIVYAVGLGIFVFWSFFNFYHLAKFGMFDFTGKLNAFIFIGFSVVIVGVTFLLLAPAPWLDSFELFDLPAGLMTVPGGSAPQDAI